MATILVVDDAKTIRLTVTEFLRDAGYEAIPADNAIDGLRLAKENDVDVVLSDIVMPQMTGIDLLRELVQHTPRTLVIMMTGLPTVDTAAEAVRAGAFDYLCKPVSKDDILRVVHNAVRLKEAEDERLRLEEENEQYREHLEELVDQRTDALRESEKRYRRLVSHAPVGIGVVRDEDLIFTNDTLKTMLHLDAAAAPNSSFMQFIAPNQRDKVRALLTQVLRDETPSELHELAMHVGDRDGVFVRLIAIPFNYGSLPAVQIVCIDITESKELELQLHQAQRLEAIGRLASGVAHDFNNLLTVILGEAQLLDLLTEDETSHRKTSEIIHAGERASLLTRQLLAFSRKQPGVLELLDLNRVVNDVAKMLRRLLGEDVRLTLKLDDNIGLINADPGQVEQVLMNLAVNARDAMPNGGRLEITTAHRTLEPQVVRNWSGVEPGEFVLLTVHDSGCGMDDETVAHIFEPFFTTKNAEEGTGLGLSTVYGVVRQANGFIDVKTRLHEGTSFTVYLPVCPGSRDAAESSKRDDIPKGTETVLVVEDDTELLAAETELLELHGYTVIPAENGQEAFGKCRQNADAIDFFLLDVVLPDMNGVQLLAYLRKIKPETPALFVSGYTSKHVVLAQMLQRDEHYLQKPFSPSRLVRQIREVLDA